MTEHNAFWKISVKLVCFFSSFASTLALFSVKVQGPCFFVYLLCEKEQGVQEVLVNMHACGQSWAPWCFPPPWGKAPQCHCCPYSVAEQGGPGGGAECSTVKRGRSACWHLPSLTAAGRGKICFSICLCSLQPFPPPTAPPHPTASFCSPLPSLNQMAPWTLFTLDDGPRCRVCPSASPFRPVSFLIPLLPLSQSASRSSYTQVAFSLLILWILLQTQQVGTYICKLFLSIAFSFAQFTFCKHISSHLLCLTPNPEIHCLFSWSGLQSYPISTCFPCIVCVDIWELPYGCILKLEIGLQMLPARKARCISHCWVEHHKSRPNKLNLLSPQTTRQA